MVPPAEDDSSLSVLVTFCALCFLVLVKTVHCELVRCVYCVPNGEVVHGECERLIDLAYTASTALEPSKV